MTGCHAPLNQHAANTEEDWAAYYEIKRTVRFVQDGGFEKVGLQFPVHLSADSTRVYRLLVDATADKNVGFYILADATFGACCVDLITAEHIGCDAVVHYGRWCGSRPSAKKPAVLYVFGKAWIDLDRLLCVSEEQGLRVLCTDTPWCHAVEHLNGGQGPQYGIYDPRSGVDTSLNEHAMVCVSEDNAFYHNLVLSHPQLFRFDPATSEICDPPAVRTSSTFLSRRDSLKETRPQLIGWLINTRRRITLPDPW